MSRPALSRLIFAIVLLATITAACAWIWGTEQGRNLRHDHSQVKKQVAQWVRQRPFEAPVLFVAVYIALGLLALPVWWLQVIGGYAFGLGWALLWCEIGAVLAATLTLEISRWLLGQWVHDRLEARLEKLRYLDERLGHNGLLVVMAARLLHFVPFSPSNYAFGLTRITRIDVIIGTAWGGIPSMIWYTTLGARRAWMADWRFWVALSCLNLLFLFPLGLRYLRPDWFKRLGVE